MLFRKSNHATAKPSLAEETAPRHPLENGLAYVVAIGLVIGAQWLISNKSNQSNLPPDAIAPIKNAAVEKAWELPNSDFLNSLTEDLNTQWPESGAGQIGDDLLQRASDAVEQQNNEKFAQSMQLLGVNALSNDDFDSALLYLDEALDMYEETENELGIASVELLKGELNIKRRAQARRAAYAYDDMQLARWKAARGQFHDAIEQLNHVVDENLALNRFGGAAAAYQTLYKGYKDHGQIIEAQEAGIEIVKLFASSGQPIRAQSMLSSLQDDGLDVQSVLELENTINALQVEYEQSISQLGQARDYRQLYNHFINAGDPVRAWQFRLKSQQVLKGVSKRAMHRRQSGVLALLYVSNDHMRDAQKSLDRAGKIFNNHGESTLSDESATLSKRVF